ncbi:MAG: hypothetical protein ACRDMX_14850 [Solirubrobacteraceae bacterium]
MFKEQQPMRITTSEGAVAAITGVWCSAIVPVAGGSDQDEQYSVPA